MKTRSGPQTRHVLGMMNATCGRVTFSVQVHSQVLEDVHVCRVGDCAHGGGAALVVDVSDGLCAHVQH